jgi:hypothetical protein
MRFRKFLVVFFKFIVPVGFLLYPILSSFHTALDWTLGSGGIILFVFLLVKLNKIFKDIEFKEKHERLINGVVTRQTKIKYEICNFIKLAILFAVINVVSLFIGDVNKFVCILAVSYAIGMLIEIRMAPVEE